jgi:hypothetical protein
MSWKVYFASSSLHTEWLQTHCVVATYIINTDKVLFADGSNDLVHCRSIINVEEFLHLSQMKLLFKLVVNIFGYGFVLNQFINLCLGSTSKKEEICL